MKNWKLIAVLALSAAFVLACLSGCGGSKDEEEAPSSDFEVNYGESQLYTQAEIDAAVDVIMAEFNTWEGCTMKALSFTDDATCEENVEYCQMLDPEGGFDQCIVFKSSFHSPNAEQAEGTAWEPDQDYNDWEWYLARSAGGDWKLLTWGY